MANEYEDNENTLRTLCLICEINSITVEFSGGGDSGGIDNVNIECTSKAINTNEIMITVWVDGGRAFNRDTQSWERIGSKKETIRLIDFIRSHAMDTIDETNVDWWNGDGGYGTWEWSNGQAELEIYQYIQESHLAFTTKEEEEEMGESA